MFLSRVAAAGGYGQCIQRCRRWACWQRLRRLLRCPISLQTLEQGKKIVILGGGIAGLVSAYELRKAGFACTVLEARERPGGRNWSVRNGSKVEFTDGTVQTCDWEEGHYLNVGPARLPSIHRTIIGYCEELGVPLEVEINTSRSTLMQANTLNGGRPVEQRQVVNDTRGYVSELLAKCIDQHGLDKVLDKEDTQRMLDFLQSYGDLTHDYSYKGSSRSGFLSPPGAGLDEEKLRPPLSLHELLVSDFSTGELYEEQIDWQATMFQPAGGMDRIPYAFAKSLGDIVHYRCLVKKVSKTTNGVRVEYTQGGSQATQTIEADYCICTLPLSILKTLDIDCTPEKKQAFGGMKMASLYKIGWESPRFWEKQYNIYGGISFPKQVVDLVWYPSNGLFTKTGIILSGFNFEQTRFRRRLAYPVWRIVNAGKARRLSSGRRNLASGTRQVADEANLCLLAEDSVQPRLLCDEYDARYEARLRRAEQAGWQNLLCWGLFKPHRRLAGRCCIVRASCDSRNRRADTRLDSASAYANSLKLSSGARSA